MKSNNSGSDILSSDFLSVSSYTVRSDTPKDHSEIYRRISEKLNENLIDIVQALKIFDKQKNGKVLPVNLHNVLNVFCHPVPLKDFEDLLQKEKQDENGFVSYKSFLSKFTNRRQELHEVIQDKENKNEISNANTEEIEMKLKQKIGKNLKNFIRSLWLYDFNQDGLIQKHEFRNVLENYCLLLSDDQFERLWSMYDPNSRGVLNYSDFLLKLGARSEAYKRMVQRNTQSKWNRQEQLGKRCAKLGRDDPEIQGQVLSKVIDTFKERVEKNFPVLLRIFQIKDSSKTGYIPLTVFHQVMNHFVMPMSLQIFKQVLNRFNFSPSAGKIQWYEFLKRVCFKDTESEKDISYYPSSHSWQICKSIMEKLRKCGQDPQNLFKSCFTMTRQDQKKGITRAELRRTINQCLIFPMSEEEFRALMFLLDPGHTNVIDCEKFLSLFNASESEKRCTVERELSSEELKSSYASPDLCGEKLIKEFRRSFNINYKNIEKAISAFDSEETGFMHVDDLRKILDNFCLSLSSHQFSEICKGFPTTGNNIFYTDFINHYKKSPYEDEEKWAISVKKLVTPRPSDKCLEKEELLKSVRDAVKAYKESFLEEFKNHDYCNAGIARKEVFWKLIDKYVFRLTEEQFNALWNTLPVNETGFLEYETFLNEIADEPSNHNRARSDFHQSPSTNRSFQSSSASINITSRPQTAGSVATSITSRPQTAGSVATSKSTRSSTKSHPRPKSAVSKHSWECQSQVEEDSNMSVRTNFTLQGCGVVTSQQYKQYKSLNFGNSRPQSTASGSCKMTTRNENAFNEDIHRRERSTARSEYSDNDAQIFVQQIKSRWRDILRRCKTKDSKNVNTIPWNEFISILHKTGITLNDSVFNLLHEEYAVKQGLPVEYWTFFKKIHLALDSKKSFHNTKVESSTGSIGLYKILLTIRDKVLKNYRDLRHAFRKADRQHCGSIKTSDFRRILHLHKIQLSEDDFFYICDYFDPKLTEFIQYDIFLEALIKN